MREENHDAVEQSPSNMQNPIEEQSAPITEKAEGMVPSAHEVEAELRDEETVIREEPPRVVQAFVPTDSYPRKTSKKVHHKHRKGTALWVVLIVLGVLLLAGGAFAYQLKFNPGSFFASSPSAAGKTPSPTAVVQQIGASGAMNPQSTPVPTATPAPTLDPSHQLLASADTSMMKDIVNVLVIGVDYAEERETWNGKHEYHSDVMMLLAINFNENRVDLISIPRDTYANIPGVKGIYKLNASINCGGGFEAEGGAGFLKTCESVSWMLGGIPVDYYYAVTMPAVKQLVDAVGGVDYDLELSFTMVNRHYKKGQQHMDGQGVLDYLRVRKNVSESGDLNRVNRQKKMMIALFESMKSQNLIPKIPDIVNSFSGQLFTNCTLQQTSALATFAYNLDQGSIGMYSMGGTMKNIFNWNFCITDQANRVDIIKNVYGVDVPEEKEYNLTYATYRWADMLAEQYVRTTKNLNAYVMEAIAADDLLPEAPLTTVDPLNPGGTIVTENGQIVGGTTTPDMTGGVVIPGGGAGPMYAAPMSVGSRGLTIQTVSSRIGQTPVERDVYRQYSEYARQLYASFTATRDSIGSLQETAQKEAAKYLNGQKNTLKSAANDLENAEATLKSQALELCSYFGYSTGSFNWSVSYEKDTDFNEVTVEFR